MSRSIGAYAVFTPWQLPPELAEMTERVKDLSLVMQPISYLARDEARARLDAGGDGDWPPLDKDTIRKKEKAGQSTKPGVGEHGGFGPTILPFWSARNAGWKTKAPHSHLFSQGTQRHYTHAEGGSRVFVFNENKRHVSRAESRKRLQRSHGRVHEPARPFDYLSDALIGKAFDMIGDFVIGEGIQK